VVKKKTKSGHKKLERKANRRKGKKEREGGRERQGNCGRRKHSLGRKPTTGRKDPTLPSNGARGAEWQ